MRRWSNNWAQIPARLLQAHFGWESKPKELEEGEGAAHPLQQPSLTTLIASTSLQGKYTTYGYVRM